MDMPDAQDRVSLQSRQRWFWIAFSITVLAPVGGIILGFAFLSEPDLRREGRVIVMLAIPWTLAVLYYLSRHMPV